MEKTLTEVAAKELSAVSDAVNKIAPGVWEAAVRSERVEGIVNVTLLLGLAVLAVVLVRRFSMELREFRAAKPKDPYGDFPVMPMIWGCAALVVSVGTIGTMCSHAASNVSRIVSPEYHAAHSLISAVRK